MKPQLSLLALSLAATTVNAGEWDYPAGNEVVADPAAARTYVELHYPTAGTATLRYESNSQLGHYYNFDIRVDGAYQPQRTLVIHTDTSGVVQRVFKSLEDTVLRDGVAITAAELEQPRRLEATTPPDLASGTVTTARVNVVDPDLRTMDKQPAPDGPWLSVSDYPNAPRFVERQVDVLDVGGQIYLSNSRVMQVDAAYLEQQDPDSGTWSQSDSASFLPQEGLTQIADLNALNRLTFASEDFVQVMAFYQIDQSLQYLQSLGFDLFEDPLVFDARGLANNNSSYFFGPKALMFGVGGSPDAMDADVVVHELGHAIHYQIVPDWGYGHTGALAEGFADYWAGSNSYRKLYQQGSDFEIDTLFNWDGYFGNKVSTRSLWNQRARYFEQSEYRAHESVAGELGDELWSTPLFQTLKQGVALYGEEAFKEVDTLVLESMYGLGRGMKMHDLAESMMFVADKLYPAREYKRLLKENLALHGLLKAPFNTEFEARYVDSGQPVKIRLLSNGRQASVEGRVQSSTGESQTLRSDKFETLNTELKLSENNVCGEVFTVTTQLDYQYQPNLQTHTWSDVQSLIAGIPQLNQTVRVQNSVIPDATQADNGSVNYGFKSFNFIINDDSQRIDDDLVIYVKLAHDNLQDVKLVLVSPAGTRKTLMANQAYSQSSRSLYWVGQHDAQAKAFTGESLAGTWRLEITDFSLGDAGSLIEWSVGRLTGYNCRQTTDNTTENNNNESGSGGGSLSWGLLLLSGLMFWRRERFNSSSK